MEETEVQEGPGSGRGRDLGVWILTGALAVLFVLAGLAKLSGDEHTAEEWAGLGFAPWTLPVVGSLEVLGAIGILVPRTAALAAACLALLMVVAVAATVFIAIPSAIIAAITFFLCAALAAIRRKDLRLPTLARGQA